MAETKPQARLVRQMMRSALWLSVFVIIGIALLMLVKYLTEDDIQKARKSAVLATINEVLPSNTYNNALLKDIKVYPPQPLLGTDEAVTVYRARKNGKPVAAVLTLKALDGYSGTITLLLAVTPKGKVLGVRALQHKETPGLGDKIEKRKSDWILSFNGWKLTPENASDWAVKKDGGEFDQFTGATITPRAVIKAIKHALTFVNQQGERLYE